MIIISYTLNKFHYSCDIMIIDHTKDDFFIVCVSHYILMLCAEDGQFLITNETSNYQHETQKKLG